MHALTCRHVILDASVASAHTHASCQLKLSNLYKSNVNPPFLPRSLLFPPPPWKTPPRATSRGSDRRRLPGRRRSASSGCRWRSRGGGPRRPRLAFTRWILANSAGWSRASPALRHGLSHRSLSDDGFASSRRLCLFLLDRHSSVPPWSGTARPNWTCRRRRRAPMRALPICFESRTTKRSKLDCSRKKPGRKDHQQLQSHSKFS